MTGKVDELVDEAVRRVLRVKFKLGRSYSGPLLDAAREKAATLTAANLSAAARDVSRGSRFLVLLKNDGGLLPLDKTVKSVAVIGPLANDKDSPLGNWRGQGLANSAISLLEGIQAAVFPDTKGAYARERRS